MIRREGNRVWLDLDEFYPLPDMHPNTVFKSMAIAFQAMGDTTTYVDLMGLSAAAFRLQVGGALCPSSPHPHLGFSCAALARETLGYEFVDHELKPKGRGKAKTVRRAVVESIDQGAPVLMEEEETGLIVGYEGDGERFLVREPYSKRGELPKVVKNPQAWGFGVAEKLPKKPGREGVVRSLEVAVELAHTNELLGEAYASGFAAYERWISHLLDESFIARAEMDVVAIILGNAHIYYCLMDARDCASVYLNSWKGEFPRGVEGWLGETAILYGQIHERLEMGLESVPWPRQLRTPSEWTEEHRAAQAAVLKEVLAMERQAINGIEGALKGMNVPDPGPG
jgi:hypothetical protein